MFSGFDDLQHEAHEPFINEFIDKVGWENIKSVMPITNGVMFFYEEKENKELDVES